MFPLDYIEIGAHEKRLQTNYLALVAKGVYFVRNDAAETLNVQVKTFQSRILLRYVITGQSLIRLLIPP